MQTERRSLAVWTGWLGILAVLSWATPARAAVGGGIFIPGGGGGGGSATNVVVRAGSGVTVTTNSTADWTIAATGGAGVTGMATNQFTTNVVGAEIVGGLGFAGTTNSAPAYYTNSAGWVRIWGDSVLASNRLTGISSYYTNGVTIYTNSVTGASNVMSAAGWTMNKGQTNFDNSVVLKNLAVGGNDTLANAVANIGSAALSVIVPGGSGNQYLVGYGANGDCYYTAGTAGAQFFRMAGSTKMKLHNSGGLSLGNTTDPGANNLNVSGNITGTNGFIVSSNSWVNQPALAEGQAAFLSSNGVPHVVWKVGGVLTTNNLTATGAADGVGISTNGGSGINNVFTNATLNDASGINTFRPSTREVVNSSGNVVADFDARNLNGTGGNALNWSADGTLVRVFNDLQVDGHLTTPAALVTNTPATDQILVYSSPTTAKATSTISPSAVNTVDFSVSGLYAVTNAITLLQFHASNVPTNNILPSSASGTNWTFCVVGGLPRMIATNYAAAGAFIKCVGETVSAWP